MQELEIIWKGQTPSTCYRLTRVARRPLVAALLALLPCLSMLAPLPFSRPAKAEIGRFDGYEIRVIRPRYMSKRNRFELGGQAAIIMNQSFIYTFLASGLLDYHFSEMLALEIDGSYGFSIDKDDKKLLHDDFKINTAILRTEYIFGGGLLWTPIYGKTELPSGQMVYFDSFVTGQVGMTGIEYTYDNCEPPRTGHPDDQPVPPTTTKAYPTGTLGFGQKYFLSQDTGLRWDVRDYIFPYSKADGECTTGSASGNGLQQNVTLQFGASTFF